MALRRPVSPTGDIPAGQACVDPAWSAQFPALASHLFDLAYEDGSSRQTSTLMILGESGVVKACINDREALRSAWVSGRTVDEVLAALEAGLQADSLDWRGRPATRWDKKRGR